jgi:prepilin-type N-terminal cleavage/methylation domain-containing protein
MDRIVRDQRGFTLTELLVVTAVLGLILAAVVLVQQKGQEAYVMGSNRVESQQNARVALDRMTQELRAATAVTAIPSATSVSFTDQNGVAVTYALSGSNLVRTEAGTPSTLIGGVQALSMLYCRTWNASTDACAATATTPAQVRVVRIELQAQTEEAAGTATARQQARMSTVVQVRNQQ